MISRRQSGFTAIFVILVAAVLGAVGYAGWYIWKGHVLNQQYHAAITKSNNPYADWHLFKNSGDEFQLYYPPNWKVTYSGGGNMGNAGQLGVLLQEFAFGPSSGQGVVDVAEYLAARSSSDSTVLTHVRPRTEIVSNGSSIFGGIAVGHDISKDAQGEYEDYIFWHNTIQLNVSMVLKADKTQFSHAIDDRQYSPQLTMMARSVCFADKYQSGQCISSHD